eukprot:scaffold660790_cov57-Prasinocladus_malaysianus.AAC.1
MKDLFGTLAKDPVEALEEGLQDLETELNAVNQDAGRAAKGFQEEFAKYNYDPKTGKGWWESSMDGASPAKDEEEAKRAAKRAQADADAAMREVDAELAEMKRKMGL